MNSISRSLESTNVSESSGSSIRDIANKLSCGYTFETFKNRNIYALHSTGHRWERPLLHGLASIKCHTPFSGDTGTICANQTGFGRSRSLSIGKVPQFSVRAALSPSRADVISALRTSPRRQAWALSCSKRKCSLSSESTPGPGHYFKPLSTCSHSQILPWEHKLHHSFSSVHNQSSLSLMAQRGMLSFGGISERFKVMPICEDLIPIEQGKTANGRKGRHRIGHFPVSSKKHSDALVV